MFCSPQIKIPLSMVDLAQTINEWKDIESNQEDDQYLGDICFSLRYVPTSGKVINSICHSWSDPVPP